MTTTQIPNVPSPCPLSTGGKDADHGDFREPVTWMRDSKKITMEQCDPAKKFDTTEPIPDYLSDLLYQFGAFGTTVIKKDWLAALLLRLKQIASTTGSDGNDDTEWTHPDLADVCVEPHSKATKPELLAHLAAWCNTLDITATSDWGPVGTAEAPMTLEAVFTVFTRNCGGGHSSIE